MAKFCGILSWAKSYSLTTMNAADHMAKNENSPIRFRRFRRHFRFLGLIDRLIAQSNHDD
jgi:hypothetical protein